MIIKDNRKNLIQASIYTIIVLIVSNILWYIGYKDAESASGNLMINAAQFFPMILCLIMTQITGEGWNDLGSILLLQS